MSWRVDATPSGAKPLIHWPEAEARNDERQKGSSFSLLVATAVDRRRFSRASDIRLLALDAASRTSRAQHAQEAGAKTSDSLAAQMVLLGMRYAKGPDGSKGFSIGVL